MNNCSTWFRPGTAKGWTAMLLTAILMLLMGQPVQADWLGEMQNGNPIGVSGLDNQEMALAFDEENNGLAVITQAPAVGFFNLYASRQTYGSPDWNAETTAINDDAGIQEPQIDLTENGNGLCVFAQYNTVLSLHRIFGVRYFNNSFFPINNSNPIDTPIGFNAEQPSVVQVDDNLALITYLQNNGSHNRIFASRYANEAWSFWTSTGWSTIGTGLPIDSIEPVNARRPHLAKSTTGEIFCVYAKEGESKGIYVSVYRNDAWYYWGVGGSGWIPAGSSNDSKEISIENANYNFDRPKLTSLSNGRMLCVYEVEDQTDGSRKILYSLYDGNNWSPAAVTERVDALAASVNASAPAVASSPESNKVICVFAKGDTGAAQAQHVYAAQWQGSGWQIMNQAQPLDNRGNTVTPITPKIAFDHRGNAIAIYQQWDVNKTSTFANYFQGPPFVETIAPDSGNNNTTVTVSVTGYNFAGGTTPVERVSARLRQTGQDDIIGTNLAVATPTGNLFTATAFTVEFDLSGVQVGDWDLLVENPDGQFYLRPAIFGVTWPDLEQAYPYPNPIKINGTGSQAATGIRFYNLVRAVKIRLYTVKGEFIRTIEKDDRQLYVEWDLRNQAGHLVAPGIYLYRIDAENGSSIHSGKVMVIR